MAHAWMAFAICHVTIVGACTEVGSGMRTCHMHRPAPGKPSDCAGMGTDQQLLHVLSCVSCPTACAQFLTQQQQRRCAAQAAVATTGAEAAAEGVAEAEEVVDGS